MKNQLCKEIKYLIETYPILLNPNPNYVKKAKANNQPIPSKKSWIAFSDTKNKEKLSEVEMRDACATFVGLDAAEIMRIVVSKLNRNPK
jgi:hypothetical protein